MSSVVGLELPNAWRTAQAQNNSFDISADQLNNTAERQLWIPTGTVDWASAILRNVTDPVLAQDVATKNYVDTNSGTQWSTFPAVQNVDMASFNIQNLLDPILDQDGATKKYVDDNVGAQTLGGLTDVTLVSVANNEVIQFNSTSGQWENKILTVPAGSEITQGNSSVTVIDTGVGRVETVIDSVLKLTIGQSEANLTTPLLMASQQIRDLGTPATDFDATTKKYVDDLFATAPSDLDGLSDVTITTPLVNQVLVNNGSGQFINQLLAKTQLPSEIAYEDEMNTFTMNNVFTEGLQISSDKPLEMGDGFILNTKYQDFSEQGSDPAEPTIDDTRLFYNIAPVFGSSDPQLVTFINRGGSIVKKPIPASETIFGLNQFSNGMFIEETGARLSDNNPTIRLQIFNESNSADPYSAILEGTIHSIASPDTTINDSNTIDLTEGTDILPVKHFVVLELVLGVPTLTSNTVSFPTTGDFVVIGTFQFQSRVSLFANNPGGNPYAVNAPDYEIKDSDIRGHLAHINDRILNEDSLYLSGIAITTAPLVGGGTATEVTYTTTSGRAFELHSEDIEAFDISAVDSIALVVNDNAQQPEEVTKVVNVSADLVGMLCGDGVDLMFSANNDTANVVLFTIHNDNEPNTTNYGITIPFQQYSNDDAGAIADVDNFAVRNVPLKLRGISLLIAELVIKFTTGGNYEILAIKDLRGSIPGASGGSGGGGAGATQLNDLSDVTINTPLVNESLINDGAGQWVNKLTPQLELGNVWTNFQDFTAIADPGDTASATVGRLFTEAIDGSNLGLFIYLIQDGIQSKVRLA